LFAFGQLVLKNRAPALGCDCVDTVAIRAGIDQLETNLPIQDRIVGEKYAAHPAARQLTHDLIASEYLGVHGWVFLVHVTAAPRRPPT
jgi:hypothetical protein